MCVKAVRKYAPISLEKRQENTHTTTTTRASFKTNNCLSVCASQCFLMGCPLFYWWAALIWKMAIVLVLLLMLWNHNQTAQNTPLQCHRQNCVAKQWQHVAHTPTRNKYVQCAPSCYNMGKTHLFPRLPFFHVWMKMFAILNKPASWKDGILSSSWNSPTVRFDLVFYLILFGEVVTKWYALQTQTLMWFEKTALYRSWEQFSCLTTQSFHQYFVVVFLFWCV